MKSSPERYQWDFNAPPIDDFLSKQYRTLSVGIFQWLPKASGKGLKRSPAAARVSGYMIESDRVLCKAGELCRRLNGQAAQAGRPEWLQKQYSVPMPAKLAAERNAAEEDKSRNFRKAKAVALKNILAPAGFVKGKHLFVRHTGNQIHGIEFQTSTWGGVYFVNVGFDYDFLPPKLAMDKKPWPWPEYHILDFISWDRLEGKVQMKDYPQEWNYWGDLDAVQENVNKTAKDAIEVLDRLSQQWKDPSDFLAQQMRPRQWYERGDPRSPYYLSLIALHIGKIDLAKQYLVAAEHAEKEFEKEYKVRLPAIAELRRKLDKVSG